MTDAKEREALLERLRKLLKRMEGMKVFDYDCRDLTAAIARIEQDGRDAERYRWLRDALDAEEIPAGLHDAFQNGPDALDNYIDAAIAAKGEGK